jgi:hypothetical protein
LNSDNRTAIEYSATDPRLGGQLTQEVVCEPLIDQPMPWLAWSHIKVQETDSSTRPIA